MIKQLLSNIYSKLINLIMDVHGVNMNQFMFQTIHPAKDYTIISNSPWKDLITFHMAPKITTNHVEDMDADEDDAMEVVTMSNGPEDHLSDVISTGVKKDPASPVTSRRVKRTHLRPYPRVQALRYTEDILEARESQMKELAPEKTAESQATKPKRRVSFADNIVAVRFYNIEESPEKVQKAETDYLKDINDIKRKCDMCYDLFFGMRALVIHKRTCRQMLLYDYYYIHGIRSKLSVYPLKTSQTIVY